MGGHLAPRSAIASIHLNPTPKPPNAHLGHTEVDGVATTGAVLWQLFGAKVATASRKMRRDVLGFVAPNTSEWGLSSGALLFRGALK